MSPGLLVLEVREHIKMNLISDKKCLTGLEPATNGLENRCSTIKL